MTDIKQDLTTPIQSRSTMSTVDPISTLASQESSPQHGLPNDPITKEGEGSGEKPPVSEEESDYPIKCPDFIPVEEVEAHRVAFKEAGIDSKVAQKVIDRLVAHGEMNEKRYSETLGQSLERDKKILQDELGAEYEGRERDIARYFYQEGISDNDVQSLVSVWGFKKTFNLFDRYAQMNKESSTGDTFVRSEGSQEADKDFDKVFNTPDFGSRVLSGDTDATKKILQWAQSQAQQV